MLGFYENFPKNIQKVADFKVSASKKRLQQTLIQTLHKLNNETFSLEDVTSPSLPQCETIFEFGVAEANNFNFLDKEETGRLLEIIRRKPLRVMDFFCAICYYETRRGKQAPLKFDYHMLRFTFSDKSMRIQVFHERGPRHVSPQEIVDFVAMKINESFSKILLKPLPQES